jgi:hypothetical protein
MVEAEAVVMVEEDIMVAVEGVEEVEAAVEVGGAEVVVVEVVKCCHCCGNLVFAGVMR